MQARTAALQVTAAACNAAATPPGPLDGNSRTATEAPNKAGSSNSASSSGSGEAAGSGSSSSSGGSGSDDAEEGRQQTAAPAGDVTWLFRRVLAMPPVQGLEALSLANLTKGEGHSSTDTYIHYTLSITNLLMMGHIACQWDTVCVPVCAAASRPSAPGCSALLLLLEQLIS
jgi:hypothetical protein